MPHNVAIVLIVLGLTQDLSVVSGVVRDEAGQPLPGVTVTLTADAPVSRDVTDETGAYRLARVRPGAYAPRASLPAFRVETQVLEVPAGGTVKDMTLRSGVLAGVLHVVPAPQAAIAQAHVIAHVRLRHRLAPRPCEELGIVSTVFESDVVAVLKGAALARIQVDQDGAGECLDGAAVVPGMAERAYAPGSELVLFLRSDGTRYHRVAGGSFAFVVWKGMVETRGWLDLPPLVTVDTFRQVLLDLAQ